MTGVWKYRGKSNILCAYACRHGACSVTPQQENALRSIARQANSEIKKVRQQFPKTSMTFAVAY
ncbi:hypothetical protein I0D08_18350 [Escherichia coli]|nr:hypothetical protein [Escherichia coli]